VAYLPRATAINDSDGNKIFDDLDAAYRTVDEDEFLPVIVSFRHGVNLPPNRPKTSFFWRAM
jgi:hypothetical protein